MSQKTAVLPFGVSEFTIWPQTFEEDVALLVREGVPYIEVCESKLDPARADDQLRMLKDSGLQVSSVQPRLHSLFPDFPRPEPKLPAERMAKVVDTIKLFSKHFPGTTLVSISGAAPGGNYAEAYRTAEREYKQLAKVAADHGVRIALEPLNPILMNVDTFLSSLDHALRVIKAVDEKAFGLFVDVWHVWEDAAAPAIIRKSGKHIFGVHINDWHTPRAFGDRVLPGKGVIPLRDLLCAICESGYEGAYTLEIFSETHLEGSLWESPAQTVREGKTAFAQLWKEICD